MDRLVEELDADGDGAVSMAEFAARVFADAGTLTAMLDDVMERMYHSLGGDGGKVRARAVFREIDLDDTGELSYQEFEEALEKLEIQLTRTQLEALIDNLDQDGDGDISYAEFINGVFGGRHVDKVGELGQGRSIMRVTVLEAKLKEPADVQKYCLVALGGFPTDSDTPGDMTMGLGKQTTMSEVRPLDISQGARERFNKAPKWNIDAMSKKPRGHTMPFEPPFLPHMVEVQCWGGQGTPSRGPGGDRLFGVGTVGLTAAAGRGALDGGGLTARKEWRVDEWLPIMDTSVDPDGKYAGRVRIRVEWVPYVPPEPEPEEDAEAEEVELHAKFLVKVVTASDFVMAGSMSSARQRAEMAELRPYVVVTMPSDIAQNEARLDREKTETGAIDPRCFESGSHHPVRWVWGEDGLPSVRGRVGMGRVHVDETKRQGESLTFGRATVPPRITLRLMNRADVGSGTPDEVLAVGTIVPGPPAFVVGGAPPSRSEPLPTDRLWTKELSELPMYTPTARSEDDALEGEGQEPDRTDEPVVARLRVKLVWDPDPSPDSSDDEDSRALYVDGAPPERRLRATLVRARGLPPSPMAREILAVMKVDGAPDWVEMGAERQISDPAPPTTGDPDWSGIGSGARMDFPCLLKVPPRVVVTLMADGTEVGRGALNLQMKRLPRHTRWR